MLNKVIVQGRMTRDPDLRATTTGKNVVNFSVACERDREVNGERQTDFIDCVAWASTAEFISKYYRKGMMAFIVGRLQIRPWEDKDGNKRISPEIQVESIYFGEPRKKDTSTTAFKEIGDESGDLPF